MDGVAPEKGAQGTKFVLVTGGVLSGVGKGVLASSTGVILKSRGVHVTHIKIDPYLNVDAGCMSPYEHGEVFVLDSGAEVDLDAGNYERFCDITLTGEHNITTGKVYQTVIENERRGDYLGKTVQIIPHISDEIKRRIFAASQIPCTRDEKVPEVCIVELGGTVGDIESMPFVEAMRQLQYELDAEDFVVIHVALVPTVGTEHKTKPTQHSVKTLRALGLAPDVICCRSDVELAEAVRAKIARFAQVKLPQTYSVYNLKNIYHVPCLLEDEGLTEYLMNRLNLNPEPVAPESTCSLESWRLMARSIDLTQVPVKIALVGKYLDSASDTYHSLIKALNHAAYAAGRKLDLVLVEAPQLEESHRLSNAPEYHNTWSRLCEVDGVVVAGGFGYRGFEGKIAASKWCREHNVPFLGICLGLQVAVVEAARTFLNLPGATSEEFANDIGPSDPQGPHVVINMPEVSTEILGGTMRLGCRDTQIEDAETLAYKLYGSHVVYERHRHRYEVNPEYVHDLEARGGLVFSGRGDSNKRMEILERPDHPFFLAVQFHPEYKTRPLLASPPFLGLLLAATGQLEDYLAGKGLPDPISDLRRATTPANAIPEWSTPPTRVASPTFAPNSASASASASASKSTPPRASRSFQPTRSPQREPASDDE